MADLAVLERWADPRALLAAGPARLTALIVKASHGHLGADRARQWRAAAAAAVELYADHPAIAWTDLAAEVGTEVRLLRATQAELAAHGRTAKPPTVTPISVAWRAPYREWPTSAARSWSPGWAGRAGSRTGRRSSPTPGSRRGHRKPGTPTARANR